MLSLNLKAVFKTRGIHKPIPFLIKAGIPRHSAANLVNNSNNTIRLDHIERICTALICEPHDLLVWTPNSGTHLPESHPLHKLKADDTDWEKAIQGLTYKELKEAVKTIAAGKKNPIKV